MKRKIMRTIGKIVLPMVLTAGAFTISNVWGKYMDSRLPDIGLSGQTLNVPRYERINTGATFPGDIPIGLNMVLENAEGTRYHATKEGHIAAISEERLDNQKLIGEYPEVKAIAGYVTRPCQHGFPNTLDVEDLRIYVPNRAEELHQ